MLERLLVQTSACMKALLSCGLLGARHGARMWAQIGAVTGTIIPFIGNLFGAILGTLIGIPLGFIMGVVAGAINRRGGWAIGAALPGLILLLLQVRTYDSDMAYWGRLWLGIVPFVGGAIAGSRVEQYVARSSEQSYKVHRVVTQGNLAAIPLGIRLGLVAVLLFSLFDFYAIICLGSTHRI